MYGAKWSRPGKALAASMFSSIQQFYPKFVFNLRLTCLALAVLHEELSSQERGLLWVFRGWFLSLLYTTRAEVHVSFMHSKTDETFSLYMFDMLDCSHLEIVAEINVLCALSTCPGGDLSVRFLRILIFISFLTLTVCKSSIYFMCFL